MVVVSVNVPLEVTGFGENAAVTPLGRPDTERFTLPLNPYCGYTPILAVPEVPWPMKILPADRVKLGA